jgi:hypothetical protein
MPYADSWQSLSPAECAMLITISEVDWRKQTRRDQRLSYCWQAARLCETMNNIA